MNDDTLDARFERDLRAVLAEAEPAHVPTSLSAAVAAVPRHHRGRDWPAIRFAVGLAGLAAAAVVAAVLLSGVIRAPGPSPIVGGPDASVTTVPAVPEASHAEGLVTAEAVACAKSSALPPLEAVISIGDTRGAVLLAGRTPDALPRVVVHACLWQRTEAGVEATDSIGGTVEATAPAQVSADRVVGSGSAPWHHLVAGRVGPGEGGVRVVLDDGSTVDAVVRDGWWLAWWEGEDGPTLVQRLDEAGTVLAEVRATEGPPVAGPASTPVAGAVTTALALDARVVSSCGSIGGCAYTVVLGDGDRSWHADLVGDESGALEAGPGLPSTLDPGTYTLAFTSYFVSDDIGPGPKTVGAVDATCSAELVVEPGMERFGAMATFERRTCVIEVLHAPAP